jgi:hypothetical protein
MNFGKNFVRAREISLSSKPSKKWSVAVCHLKPQMPHSALDARCGHTMVSWPATPHAAQMAATPRVPLDARPDRPSVGMRCAGVGDALGGTTVYGGASTPQSYATGRSGNWLAAPLPLPPFVPFVPVRAWGHLRHGAANLLGPLALVPPPPPPPSDCLRIQTSRVVCERARARQLLSFLSFFPPKTRFRVCCVLVVVPSHGFGLSLFMLCVPRPGECASQTVF